MAPFASSKLRSLFADSSSSSASPETASPARHNQTRPFSMASSITVVPPSPIPPTHQQPSTLATLQYQEGLIADFWSGSAARAPSPHASSSSHTTSSSSASSGGKKHSKSKWADAIKVRDAERSSSTRTTQGAPEPKTRARLFFLLGFLFPLSWLVGAMLLFWPPTPYAELTAGLPMHSPEARERRLAAYRDAETKWAKRCLWAWVCVMAIVPVVVVAAVLASKHGP